MPKGRSPLPNLRRGRHMPVARSGTSGSSQRLRCCWPTDRQLSGPFKWLRNQRLPQVRVLHLTKVTATKTLWCRTQGRQLPSARRQKSLAWLTPLALTLLSRGAILFFQIVARIKRLLTPHKMRIMKHNQDNWSPRFQ